MLGHRDDVGLDGFWTEAVDEFANGDESVEGFLSEFVEDTGVEMFWSF